MATPAISPKSILSAPSRIESLDALRGFALMGVLMVNLSYNWLARPVSEGDRLARSIVECAFEHKFWPLFSLLFGISFSLIMQRAEVTGPAGSIFTRRLVLLGAFGLVNVVLLLGNPILLRYAILGSLLFAVRRHGQGYILMLALGMSLLAVTGPPLWNIVKGRPPEASFGDPQYLAAAELAEQQRQRTEARRVNTTGTFAEVTWHNARGVVRLLQSEPFWLPRMPQVAVMLLLGMYVGRHKLLWELNSRRSLLRTVCATGMLAGSLGTAVYLRTTAWSKAGVAEQIAHRAIRFWSADLLAIGYAAAVVLLYGAYSHRLPWLFGSMASAGRMALTNFLLQSLIMRLLFDRFFLGLDRKLGPAVGIVVVLIIYAAQLAWSARWLTTHRFGPVEWLWRVGTHLQFQPWRVRLTTAPAGNLPTFPAAVCAGTAPQGGASDKRK